MPDTAALIAVPLPLSNPVTVVRSVIAGVVVAVATVPARPFADTTDTLLTEPAPEAGKAAVRSTNHFSQTGLKMARLVLSSTKMGSAQVGGG